MEGTNCDSDDGDLNELFDEVASKLGWKSDANLDLDILCKQLSQSTKKKKKRDATSTKKSKKINRDTQKDRKPQSSKKGVRRNASNSSSRNEVKKTLDAVSTCSIDVISGSASSESSSRNTASDSIHLPLNKLHGDDDYDDERDSKYNPLASPSLHAKGRTPDRDRDGVSDLHPDRKPIIEGNCETINRAMQDKGTLDSLTELEIALSELQVSCDDEIDLGEAVINSTSLQNHVVEEIRENEVSSEDERCDDVEKSNDHDCSKSDEVSVKVCNNAFDKSIDFKTDTPTVTQSFTDSPEPMGWLMSPQHKAYPAKIDPIQIDSDSENEDGRIASDAETDDETGNVLGSRVLSLMERLAQNHQKKKNVDSASRRQRRRSCANPRAKSLISNKVWANDSDGKDDDGERDEGSRTERGFLEDDDEEERSTRDEEKATSSTASFQKPRVKEEGSSSDDDFESFLNAIKTPHRATDSRHSSDSDEAVIVLEDDDFIDDTPLESDGDDEDDVFYLKMNNLTNPLTNGKKPNSKHHSVGSRSGSILSHIFPASDDEDEDIFVTPRSTPSVKKTKPKASTTSSTTSKKTTSKPLRPLQSFRLDSYPTTPSQKPPPSFLASLSTPSKGTSTRSRYVSDFKRHKDELTQRLFKLYNESIFESKLPEDFSITWNNRMRKTAGYCIYKKKYNDRTARIELSVKVCDSAERLRDTLVHELCHAAAWLIHGVSDGHGKFWKYWAAKANLAHPEIPVIRRCHSYEINTKFKYKCVQCGNIIGRHSKSVDTARFCCAYCNGKLVLQPTLKKDGTPARQRGPNPFAAFVKENYATLKKTHTGAKHAEVMRLLSQEFASKAKIADS